MKKLLVFFMVLALVAPAMAADNLSLSGEVRVRSWDEENFSDFDDNGTGDKTDYLEQRFRLQATIKANDQVKAVTRIDLAEISWGSETWNTHRPGLGEDSKANLTADANDVIQVDRAYLDITTGPVNIKAGQQFYTVGQSYVIRNNKPGIQLTFKAPVVIELGWSREQDEDVSGTTDLTPGQDEDNLHLSVGYKAEAFEVEGFYGQQVTKKPGDIDDEKTVFGVNVKTSVGPVKLNAELAIFGGDDGATVATDYVGTQFNVDADMKLSDMIKIGADLVYSDGTDDARENKIVYIGDPFGNLNRAEGGSGNYIFAGDHDPLGSTDVFDPFGDQVGAMGLGVDVVITPMAGLDLLVHVLYLTATEDASAKNTTAYEDALVYNLGVTYAIAPKATLGLYYNAVAPSFDSYQGATATDDEASLIGGLLQINF